MKETFQKKIDAEIFSYIPGNYKKDFQNKILENNKLISFPGIDLNNLNDVFSVLSRKTIKNPLIYIGAGTCGLGAGAGKSKKAIHHYLQENKIEAEIIEVGCIGLCSSEPLMDIKIPGRKRISFQQITEDKVLELMRHVFAGRIPKEDLLGQFRSDEGKNWEGVPFLEDHPFFAPQTRWVLANCGMIDPTDIDEYIALGGYSAFIKTINSLTPQELCDIVEASGLRGRGGGGFPTGKKWKFALNTDAEQKYMICNADEGDPGAFMDRAVIEGDPHRLLEGLAIAAYGVGASKAYIYIRAEYPLAIVRLKQAIADATCYGLFGENIFDSGYSLEVVIKQGAGAFVCGEETALIHSIEGKRGMPRPRPPFPAISGLFSKPTIINNVETLANVPLIIKRGADYFSQLGTENSKGTKVFAVSGKIKRTGLIEVKMGTSIKEIVFNIGGGVPGNFIFKSVQIGGPSGGCVPQSHIDTQVDYESLKTVGAMMGSGGLVVMDEKTCMVDVAKFFMDFIQRESCGKCIPCREGTKRLLEILQTITRNRKNERDLDTLHRFKGIMAIEELSEVIKETSLCGLGQTAPNPVLSTLKWFRDEYEAHIFERKCAAGVCTELLTYKIDEKDCIGCGICQKKCPAEAIMGKSKTPHYIIPEKCIGCGACMDACRFNAVIAE